MKEKIRIGIIGPGKVTENALQKFREISDRVSSIIFYNHGSKNFEKQFNSHLETIVANRDEFPKGMKSEVRSTEDFNEFMDSSDVLIYNVGISTPNFLIKRDFELVDNFENLEGVLGREAGKYAQEYSQEYSGRIEDLIIAYYTLKETNKLRKLGYFDKPLRLHLFLPMILPVTIRYARAMRDYFNISRRNPSSKLLIVNANSSENNLNIFLEHLPEMKHSALSLAIDEKRLRILCKTRQLFSSYGIKDIGAVGDHDTYIIPNVNNTIPDEVISKIQTEIKNYYTDRVGFQDLIAQAGDGVIDILKGIFSGAQLTSGYFSEIDMRKIGEKQDLRSDDFGTDDLRGDGLRSDKGITIVDKYTIDWDGEKFRIIPNKQVLKKKKISKLMKTCIAAHIKLQKSFIDNPVIPIYKFPGNDVPKNEPIDVIERYNHLDRLKTEILVPIIDENRDQSLVALNPSTSERRIFRFKDRGIDDLLRCVRIISLNKEKMIACGFTDDYVLIDPDSFEQVGGRKIKSGSLKDNFSKRNQNYKINSIVGVADRILLTHQFHGLISIDEKIGTKRWLCQPVEGRTIKEIKINPNDGNLYAIIGKKVVSFTANGKIISEYPSYLSNKLQSLTFIDDEIYVTTTKRKGRSYILKATTKQPFLEPLKNSDTLTSDLMFLDSFVRDDEKHLICSERGSVIVYNTNGNSIERKYVFSNKGEVAGIVMGFHGYVSIMSHRSAGDNLLIEYDSIQNKDDIIFDFGGRKEKILPTLAVLERRPRS